MREIGQNTLHHPSAGLFPNLAPVHILSRHSVEIPQWRLAGMLEGWKFHLEMQATLSLLIYEHTVCLSGVIANLFLCYSL